MRLPTVEDALALSSKVQSAVDETDCRALFKWARLFHEEGTDAQIVELGAWKGRSAIVLACGAPCHDVHSVDIWEPFTDLVGQKIHAKQSEFEENLRVAGLRSRVVPVKASTIEAARTWPRRDRVGFLFIDADHREDAVRADWNAWSRHLAYGATVAFHDYDLDGAGVRAVVNELVAQDKLRVLERVRSRFGTVICRKLE